MKIRLAKSELIHFVGIGGIGMSGLALIMTGLGFKVQGSDKSLNKRDMSKLIKPMKEFGAHFFPENKKNFPLITKLNYQNRVRVLL